MTTIATDGKCIVSDGRGARRGVIVCDELIKIDRLDDGRLIGIVGTLDDFGRGLEWFNKGGNKPTLDEETSFLVVGLDGVFIYDSKLHPQPAISPTAIGSGFEIAIGAMDAGASPHEAIMIASRRDPYTGGSIRSLLLE